MLLITLLFISPVLFYFILKSIKFGSDHYYHQLLIDLITENKNRFIYKHNNIINENIVSYPQFLHWLFSFLSPNFIEKISSKIIIIFSFLSNISFLIFIVNLSGFIKELNDTKIISIIILLFVLVPYNYNTGNAKNTGASARGLGLFLGQCLIYLLIFYELTDSIKFIYLSIIPALFILISSQFATQFLFFICLSLALIFSDFFYLISPLGASLIFFIIMPKVAFNFFKGQLGHKSLYYKYLAKVYILKNRQSIWSDIYYVIPTQIYYYITRQIPKLKYNFLNYLYNNSLIILIFQMPIVFISFIFFFVNGNYNICELIMIKFAASLFCVFLLITLRPLRFLGEPERYLEFGFGLFSILSVLLLPKSLVILILIYSICFILIDYLVKLKNKSKNNSNVVHDNFISSITEVKKILFADKDSKLITDSIELTKFFLDKNINIYFFTVNSFRSDKFHFSDLYKNSYSYIDPVSMINIIQHYKINYVLVDGISWKNYHNDLELKSIAYRVCYDSINFKLLKLQNI